MFWYVQSSSTSASHLPPHASFIILKTAPECRLQTTSWPPPRLSISMLLWLNSLVLICPASHKKRWVILVGEQQWKTNLVWSINMTLGIWCLCLMIKMSFWSSGFFESSTTRTKLLLSLKLDWLPRDFSSVKFMTTLKHSHQLWNGIPCNVSYHWLVI